MTYIPNITHLKGDPKVLHSGGSSLAATDQLGRLLGWFSIGLGLVELFAPRRITRALGVEGNESLVRAYGAREISSGILSLSVDKQVGLWSRVVGDGLDMATLATAFHPSNSKRHAVGLALAMVLGITLLDLTSAGGIAVRHGSRRDNWRRYQDRTGFPGGIEKARGAAEGFKGPA